MHGHRQNWPGLISSLIFHRAILSDIAYSLKARQLYHNSAGCCKKRTKATALAYTSPSPLFLIIIFLISHLFIIRAEGLILFRLA